jgi:Tfp pilus assembly protein FimT
VLRPTSTSRRLARRRQAGFTLLELMTIVTIILIMAAIVAPAAGRTMAIYRAQEFASDVLMMARAARRESMESGRATVVRFMGTRVEVRRGQSSLCRATNWVAAFGDACATGADVGVGSCVGVIDAAAYSTGYHSVSLTPVAASDYDVCYQPNGEALAAPGDGAVFSRLPPRDGNFAALLDVSRLEGGTSVDPLRRLVIPFDSAPRSGR